MKKYLLLSQHNILQEVNVGARLLGQVGFTVMDRKPVQLIFGLELLFERIDVGFNLVLYYHKVTHSEENFKF